MAEIIYNIPLRKEILKVPKYKRAKKAIKAIREFLKRHVKKEDIKLGKYLNMKVLEHGRKNVPHHVEVKVTTEKKKVKDKEIEITKAELVGAPAEKEIKKEEKKEPKIKAKEEKKETEEKKKEAEKKEEQKVIEEKSGDLAKRQKAPKLKRGKLPEKISRGEDLRTRFVKDQKPSHLRKVK